MYVCLCVRVSMIARVRVHLCALLEACWSAHARNEDPPRRFAGPDFPPRLYFKVYTTGMRHVYMTGEKFIAPGSQAAKDACKGMGEQLYREVVERDLAPSKMHKEDIVFIEDAYRCATCCFAERVSLCRAYVHVCCVCLCRSLDVFVFVGTCTSLSLSVCMCVWRVRVYVCCCVVGVSVCVCLSLCV